MLVGGRIQSPQVVEESSPPNQCCSRQTGHDGPKEQENANRCHCPWRRSSHRSLDVRGMTASHELTITGTQEDRYFQDTPAHEAGVPSECASPRFRINSRDRDIGAPWAKQVRLWSFGRRPNDLRSFNSLRQIRLAPRVGFEPTASRLTAEQVKNLSAVSGVAYRKLGAILTSLAAPNPAPKRYLQTARDT